MSCFLQRNKPPRPQPRISWLKTSGYSRSIKGTGRLRVTVCNVPAYISGDFLASYLSAYGKVEINLLRSPAGTASGDYTFRLCLTRDGFKAIPETLISGDRQMMVEIGHIAKFCPQETEGSEKSAVPTTTDTTATTISKKAEVQGPGQVQPKTNNQEGWTEVTRKRRGSPKQGETGTTSPPPKQTTPAPPPGKKPVSTPENQQYQNLQRHQHHHQQHQQQ